MLKNLVNTRVLGFEKNEFQNKNLTSMEGVGKMIFDTVDFEFLRLTGLCRYMPSGICRKYDTPMFKRSVISNLKVHRLIKLMSDKMSYKLTKKGRDCLAEMGMTFAKDARTDLKKASYQRKLKNAQWNVLLTLAGIDVYYETAKKLATEECGYFSSLMLRADNMLKVLSCAKFYGILKIAETVYVPYYVENEESWIYPKFESEIYRSQTDSMKNVKDIRLILIGESLEELWAYINSAGEHREFGKGMKPFKKALEELACEYLLVPFGRDGVMQMSVLKIARYRERLAKAIGCTDTINLSECDGIRDGVPHIIAIDCNEKRIVRAIRQIEGYDKTLISRVCCLPFQKSTIIKIIKKNGLPKTIITPIPNSEIHKVFPEIKENEIKRAGYVTKEGTCIEVYETNLTKVDFDEYEE